MVDSKAQVTRYVLLQFTLEMEISLALTVFLLSLILIYCIATTRPPQIPGPPPHPFVGHTFQVPIVKTWRYFEKLSLKYGPIVKLTLAGDDMIVLSNPSDAEELLGRRSHNYSSRRPLVYAGEYLSKNLCLVLLPYGEALKRQRAAFHQMVQPRGLRSIMTGYQTTFCQAVGGYEDMQDTESLRPLMDLVTTPTDWSHHCTRFSASLVFKLSYGQQLDDDGKDLAALEDILATLMKDFYPGAHLVDAFPILDRLPDFLAPWRAGAKRKHLMEVGLYTRLTSEVRMRMESDIGLECFAARLWDHQEKMNITPEELAYVAGSAFTAGTDTTAGTIEWFLMAMVLYPSTMLKAQKEIDLFFSSDTVPGYSAMNDLSYCFALAKEVFRWAPVAPAGIPHYSDAEDVYNGFTIRKGTMIIPCIWNMHHNESEFPNSHTFDPERFLKSPNGNPDSLTEGHYGFAKTIWIAIVRVLWAFNIEPCRDASGNVMDPDPDDCTSGTTW
ncbi:cytochrome P450 [Mycena albidolilacea]|uniref:Cytochrome P450 n=1 Tax=Mycena albidolilacea TaxID=1033008 RepID=A0AAD7EDP2_9AGAR|nr:cytochrome P450 [Mycena albidolilacea]